MYRCSSAGGDLNLERQISSCLLLSHETHEISKLAFEQLPSNAHGMVASLLLIINDDGCGGGNR
uniref:Uncharacterized protein n=1 Tax=Setaria digitata TaxID=48799 RepID=A0A915PX80_9BILA